MQHEIVGEQKELSEVVSADCVLTMRRRNHIPQPGDEAKEVIVRACPFLGSGAAVTVERDRRAVRCDVGANVASTKHCSRDLPRYSHTERARRFLDLSFSALSVPPRHALHAIVRHGFCSDLPAQQLSRYRLPHVPAAPCTRRFLDLSFNAICSLPPGLSRLSALNALNLSYNPLAAFPEVLTALTSLMELNLDHTGAASAGSCVGAMCKWVSARDWVSLSTDR